MVQWLLKARGTDDIGRYPLTYIHIKNSLMVATNGHVLHLIKAIYSFSNGVYKVIRDRTSIVLIKNDDIEYLKWESVFPRGKFKKVDEIYGTKNTFDKTRYYSRIIRSLPEDRTLNKDYFDNIVSDYSSWKAFIFESSDSDKPVMFRAKNKTALLMLMRIG